MPLLASEIKVHALDGMHSSLSALPHWVDANAEHTQEDPDDSNDNPT